MNIPNIIYSKIAENLSTEDLINFYLAEKHPDISLCIQQKRKNYIKNKIINLLEKYRNYYCGFQIIIILDSNTYKIRNHNQNYYKEEDLELKLEDFSFLDTDYKNIEFYTSNLYMLYYNITDFIKINSNTDDYLNIIDECSIIYINNLKNIISQKFDKN